jgi:hypothetical protein
MADETEEQKNKERSKQYYTVGMPIETVGAQDEQGIPIYGSTVQKPQGWWDKIAPSFLGGQDVNYEVLPISLENLPSAEELWNKDVAEARKGANTYDEQYYREQRDLFSNAQMDAAAKLAAWDRAIAGAYGAAGAQARRGGQTIYSAGQRAAGEVAGASDAAAARAAGYLSGQGMPSTMVSGLAGTSGGESFDPTMGRAYGGLQAETIGREAAYDAQELAARGSGMSAGRQSLLDSFLVQTEGLLLSLDSAAISARAQGRAAEAAAVKAVEERAKNDVLSPQTLNLVERRANEAWNNAEVRKLFGDDRDAYNTAIAYLVEQKSRRVLTDFWNLVSYGTDVQPFLPPSAEESAAALAALTGQ